MTSSVIAVLVAAVLSLAMYAQLLRRKLVLAQRERDDAANAKVVWLHQNPIRRQLSANRR